MPEAPVTVCGLPLIAVVNAGTYYGPDGPDDWAEVESLYWRKRDGSRGKHVSNHLYQKLLREGDEAVIIEQMWDWLTMRDYEEHLAQVYAPKLYQSGPEDGYTIDGWFKFN